MPTKSPPSRTSVLESKRAVDLARAAELTSISERTLRDWIAQGKLPAYRVGRRLRVFIEDLEALFVPVGSDSK